MPKVIVRGGYNGEGDCVVSAVVEGAEFGTPAYEAHYGYTEADSFREGYEYVVAEAGLAGFAPAWDDTRYAGGLVASFSIEVLVD